MLWNYLVNSVNHIFYCVGVGICFALLLLAIPNIITVLIKAYTNLWDVVLIWADMHKAFLEFYKERILKEPTIKGEWKED